MPLVYLAPPPAVLTPPRRQRLLPPVVVVGPEGTPADTNILAHPAAFYANGTTSWITTTDPNEILFAFTGTSLSVEIDDAAIAALGGGATAQDHFMIACCIDNGDYGAALTALNGSNIGSNVYRVALASGLANTLHQVRILITRPIDSDLDLYTNNPPTGALIINRFCDASGGSLVTSAYSYLRSKTLVTYGDSRVEPGRGNMAGILAASLDAYDIRVTHQGQGMVRNPGNGQASTHIPDLATSYGNYWTGRARSTMTDVTYVAVYSFGANDIGLSGATWQANATTVLTGLLTLYPNATILAIPDIGSRFRTELLAAIAAVGSPRILTVDLFASHPEFSAQFQATASGVDPATLYSIDQLHLSTIGIGVLGGEIAGLAVRAVAAVGGYGLFPPRFLYA